MEYSAKRTGIGIADVLTLILIVLKLVGVINWSWVWVLSPVWISIIILIVMYGIIAICDSRPS